MKHLIHLSTSPSAVSSPRSPWSPTAHQSSIPAEVQASPSMEDLNLLHLQRTRSKTGGDSMENKIIKHRLLLLLLWGRRSPAWDAAHLPGIVLLHFHSSLKYHTLIGVFQIRICVFTSSQHTIPMKHKDARCRGRSFPVEKAEDLSLLLPVGCFYHLHE